METFCSAADATATVCTALDRRHPRRSPRHHRGCHDRPSPISNEPDVMRCPHFILVPEQYREDGTCRCNDQAHTIMRDWGYRWDQRPPIKKVRRIQVPPLNLAFQCNDIRVTIVEVPHGVTYDLHDMGRLTIHVRSQWRVVL
jgi:hypothetical protein